MNNNDKKNRPIYEALNRASSFLREQGREEGAARLLLQHVLKADQTGLLMKLRDELEPEAEAVFQKLLEKHAAGVPVQHLTGEEMFYGRPFSVNPHVLIPRPETEELIEETLRLMAETLPANKPPAVADIGTGSGAIAVTLKCERPDALVTATDISEEALKTAAENAVRHGAEVAFLKGSLAEPLRGRKWDVIVSNPPYIGFGEAASLSDTVRDHEPHSALFAENEGLALYEELVPELPSLISTPGIIGFEIGHTQGEAVKALLEKAFPGVRVFVKKDINKNDRMVFCLVG